MAQSLEKVFLQKVAQMPQEVNDVDNKVGMVLPGPAIKKEKPAKVILRPELKACCTFVVIACNRL